MDRIGDSFGTSISRPERRSQPECNALVQAMDLNEDDFEEVYLSEDEEGGTRIGGIYIPAPLKPHCSVESKGPRLIIQKIVNKNFKSYAGEIILGPFHHCFTAIIGPNGSGKSNVIDSMLFVFGYRANKIRCKKISTLLHNSAEHPNMTFCSVAVHFVQINDKENGEFDLVPKSELVVERIAYKDNSSHYTINGRKVQFKEVANILREHHIDLDHNRFLILQGEVESIAMMKPKGHTENECGMLEYLEDIIGTSRYKGPLMKINNRVDQLTEDRTEKHNRCKLAEREMKDLEKPFNDAVEFLRKENENTRTKNLRIQKCIHDINKQLVDLIAELEGVKNELKEHDDAANVLKTTREEKERLIRLETEQFESFREKKDALQKQLSKASSNFRVVQQTMAMTNKRRKDNKVQVEKLENELSDLHKLPEKNKKEIKECEFKIEKLTVQTNQTKDELQKSYSVLEEKTKPLIDKREKLETELIELKKCEDEAKSALTLAESELKILKHDETTELRKYESIKTSYQQSEQDLETQRVKIIELTKILPTLQHDITTKTKRVEEILVEEERLTAKLKLLHTEINEKVVNMQTIRTNNKVLDFLMRQKNEGKIPGILGRLGDLGGIDAKYDVAISTACGRLDNIIVDTVDTAQECIENLKRFDVGRASFVALEKVQYLQNQMGPIQTPENAFRLFDLVRVEDERVLPAFYFALRNTLVANDLEQGTRIAYGAYRYRVVTLKGDVIETSGTMSGGGNTQIRGKMGTKVQTKTRQSINTSFSKKAIEDMQVQAEQMQSRINSLNEEQSQLERDIRIIKNNFEKHGDEIQKLKITIKSLEEHLPRTLNQLKVQKKRMEATTSDAGKVSVLEEDIKQKQKEFAEVEDAANAVSLKIKDIKTNIDTLHGTTIKSTQNKITSLESQIKKLNKNVSKLKVEITTSERSVEVTKEQIDNLRNEITKDENHIKELSIDRQKYDEETVQLSEELKKAQSEIDNAKSESSELQKEISKIRKEETENKLMRIDIEAKVESANEKVTNVKAEIPYQQDKLKPLELNEIPGDSELQPLKTYTEEELESYTLKDLRYKEKLQEEVLKKKPNLSCINEYTNKREVYLERVKVLEDITSKRNEMRQLHDDVRKKRYHEFMNGFQTITRKLKEMYQMITQGGDAELELVDSMDPFTDGVLFSVRPPKKTWKNISNLSGGEKTLSSLALVFALHYYKPSPLYFMDEIDAALDFKNISIVAHYIKERTKNAQFIIISLRSNMFELSNYVVGIYKIQDCTNSITILNAHFKKLSVEENVEAEYNGLLEGNNNTEENTETSMTQSTDTQDQVVQKKSSANNNKKSTSNDTQIAQKETSNVTAESSNQELESIFVPQGESTTASQDIQTNLTTNSITETFFKRPLPPGPN